MTRWGRIVAIAAGAGLIGTQALGSGGPPPVPDYVTAYAVYPEDIAALANGHPGIIKGAAPEAVLYLDWRLLHGWTVGTAAGTALATPCCGSRTDPSFAWVAARGKVPGIANEVYYVAADRPGPDYTSVPTCFADAFDTAVKTLGDRMAHYGAASPSVRAWVAAQDAVFRSCSKPGVTLPAVPADAPAWLVADRAYQTAAIALYDGRLADADAAFARIGRDPASPWRSSAPYLRARVAQRAVLLHPDPTSFARAHAAIASLAAAPDGTYGRGELGRLRQVLAYREHPRDLLASLDRELNAPLPPPDVAVKFKDYMSLARAGAGTPEAADWIHSVRSTDRLAGRAHARERWAATHDGAWLIAALSLAMPDDPGVAELIREAAAVRTGDPAWLTAQYHFIRLTMARSDSAAVRARTNAILARSGLTTSDRNIVAAIRTQVAAGLDDFIGFALRTPYCTAGNGTCIADDWPSGDGLLGRRGATFVGWGGDARAIIDRLPMAPRLRLAGDTAVPRSLRLDIALTSYTRAVLLQDDVAVDHVATMLVDLLPQVRADWRVVVHARPGVDKRFAEFFVMAKIPTLRTDLASYTRPTGVRDRDFAGYWVPWMIIPRGRPAPAQAFPPDSAYGAEGYWEIGREPDRTQPPPATDLACFGRCGAGSFTLRAPPFSVPLLGAALLERRAFLVATSRGVPIGAASIWGEMLAYVRARPRDPRSPETLYRLIRIARWGGNQDHVGRRAFDLLHARYPASRWTARSPFYYDDH